MYAAAAAKSLQSCPTLCDPTDGSPPGFPIPGILQARTLEWVPISLLVFKPSQRKKDGVGRFGTEEATIKICRGTFGGRRKAVRDRLATHSSVLAWRIPGTEKPVGLLSMGSHRVGQD